MSTDMEIILNQQMISLAKLFTASQSFEWTRMASVDHYSLLRIRSKYTWRERRLRFSLWYSMVKVKISISNFKNFNASEIFITWTIHFIIIKPTRWMNHFFLSDYHVKCASMILLDKRVQLPKWWPIYKNFYCSQWP